ncbi:2-dehydropantoate 2-reductase N-terminal domain-containing protein, partial [Agathobacter rectalis]
MNTEEKKIAVIGIGGVGGYIAGLLAKAYPHVTMVARGARAESIRKKGLVLHSDY